MKIYKLLNQDMTSRGGCLWTLGEWKETSGAGELCSAGWLHGYEDPLLAVLHIPVHSDIKNPRLFEGEAEGKIKRDGQMKLGASRMRVVREIPVPEITTEQRVRYGILCALAVRHGPEWEDWARKWLSGEDRTQAAAERASWTAKWAAEAAKAAAERASWTAKWAAAEAAAEAARAAAAAAAEGAELNLIAIAESVCADAR